MQDGHGITRVLEILEGDGMGAAGHELRQSVGSDRLFRPAVHDLDAIDVETESVIHGNREGIGSGAKVKSAAPANREVIGGDGGIRRVDPPVEVDVQVQCGPSQA